jgi:N-methylhydantoinase B/oxoprolinase/acetone carboxylase alpha subunit
MNQIISRSEKAIRGEIQKIPDGVYEFTDFFDDYGRDTEPIRVHVKVTVDGSDINIDFTGSSPQNGEQPTKAGRVEQRAQLHLLLRFFRCKMHDRPRYPTK